MPVSQRFIIIGIVIVMLLTAAVVFASVFLPY
jgi:hypothetical protein